MSRKNSINENQLKLNFEFESAKLDLAERNSMHKIVYLNDAISQRSEKHKQEILNMFSDYAAKLSW